MMKHWVVVLVGFLLLSPQVVLAEPASAPDVVMLKSGGMLRGTISELTPGERVVILLVTGEVRTLDMAEVTYAGPADEVPSSASKKKKKKTPPASQHDDVQSSQESAPRPPATATAPQVQREAVRFDSQEPGLRVHVAVASGEGRFSHGWGTVSVDTYQALCTVPCSVSLAPGSYQFGVSEDDGRPAKAENYVNIEGGESVEVSHKSYAWLRTTGWVTMIGSAVVGGALIFTADNECEPFEAGCEAFNKGQIAAGFAVFGVGALAGYLMTLKDDEASVSVSMGAFSTGAPPVRLARDAGTPAETSVTDRFSRVGLGIVGTF